MTLTLGVPICRFDGSVAVKDLCDRFRSVATMRLQDVSRLRRADVAVLYGSGLWVATEILKNQVSHGLLPALIS